MIKYKIHDTIVSIDTNDPNDIGYIKIEGDLQPVLSEIIPLCFGYYGHRLGTECSPRDLDAAMYQPELVQFEPKLVEGAEILESEVFPEFPEGAVS